MSPLFAVGGKSERDPTKKQLEKRVKQRCFAMKWEIIVTFSSETPVP